MRYRLSKAAAADLEGIFEYGLDTFGVEEAITYQMGLEAVFETLLDHPRLGVRVDHIRAGYRRDVHAKHSIYYRLDGTEILIIRILGRQDAGAALANKKSDQ